MTCSMCLRLLRRVDIVFHISSRHFVLCSLFLSFASNGRDDSVGVHVRSLWTSKQRCAQCREENDPAGCTDFLVSAAQLMPVHPCTSSSPFLLQVFSIHFGFTLVANGHASGVCQNRKNGASFFFYLARVDVVLISLFRLFSLFVRAYARSF